VPLLRLEAASLVAAEPPLEALILSLGRWASLELAEEEPPLQNARAPLVLLPAE
jgi:hypothetical protein